MAFHQWFISYAIIRTNGWGNCTIGLDTLFCLIKWCWMVKVKSKRAVGSLCMWDPHYGWATFQLMGRQPHSGPTCILAEGPRLSACLTCTWIKWPPGLQRPWCFKWIEMLKTGHSRSVRRLPCFVLSHLIRGYLGEHANIVASLRLGQGPHIHVRVLGLQDSLTICWVLQIRSKDK